MNNKLLNTGIQNFINKNFNTDISTVLLKRPYFEGVNPGELAQQLESKKKCQKKLPSWFKTSGIYYPKKVSIEQSSSEVTAAYKSLLISGNSLIDLSGGMGVDTYYFSKKMETVIHCELDKELSKIVAHNFKKLGTENIKCFTGDGIGYLIDSKKKFDWVYIDPSRRNRQKGKVFRLEECEPNIIETLPELFRASNKILVKTSPLLDLKTGITELAYVASVHIIAVKNEVKELLWVLKKGFSGKTQIKTVNLIDNQIIQYFDFTFDKEQDIQNVDSDYPKKYLYEPNAAVMKAGAFKLIASRFSLAKLHRHSHLYTSNSLVEFPGRRFKIYNVIPYKKKNLKQLPQKANISVRNFNESVAQLRKKTKIKDGGDEYLFFTTNIDNEKVIICSKKLPNRGNPR